MCGTKRKEYGGNNQFNDALDKSMRFLIVGLALILQLGFSEEFRKTEWTTQAVSMISPKEWARLNLSNNEYEVKIESTKVFVLPLQRSTDNVKLLPKGKLVASDQGEFGGGLYQYFEKGNGSRKIMDGRFHSFFDWQGRTYVFEGDDWATHRGKIWNLYEINGIWHLGKSIDIKLSPYAYCFKDKNSLYVVTPEQLLDVNLEKQTTRTLIEKAFWPGLFPNSVAKESDSTLWIGMKGGILEVVNPDSPKLLWHTRKKPK